MLKMLGADEEKYDGLVKEGMAKWIVYILTSSSDFKALRGEDKDGGKKKKVGRLTERVLEICFSETTSWHLHVAEKIIKECGSEGGSEWEYWRMILEAAKDDEDVGVEMKKTKKVEKEKEKIEDMDVDVDVEMAGGAVQEAEIQAEIQSNEDEENGDGGGEKLRGPWKRVGLWRPKPIGVLPAGWEDDE